MDWVCSGCNRHYSWAVTECPHCQPCITVTTSGTQPKSHNIASPKLPSIESVIEHVYNQTGGYVGWSPGAIIKEVWFFIHSQVTSGE